MVDKALESITQFIFVKYLNKSVRSNNVFVCKHKINLIKNHNKMLRYISELIDVFLMCLSFLRILFAHSL